MQVNSNMNNFLKLVSKEPAYNKIVTDVLSYEENKEWLDRSANIAIKILSTLRHNRKENRFPNTQKDLAEIMNITPQQVNKMVKGTENLTLETISRVEKALDIQLIDIHSEPKKVVISEMELV
jgi:DNA-binding Xre family transcriptional regulator